MACRYFPSIGKIHCLFILGDSPETITGGDRAAVLGPIPCSVALAIFYVYKRGKQTWNNFHRRYV